MNTQFFGSTFQLLVPANDIQDVLSLELVHSVLIVERSFDNRFFHL